MIFISNSNINIEIQVNVISYLQQSSHWRLSFTFSIISGIVFLINLTQSSTNAIILLIFES